MTENRVRFIVFLSFLFVVFFLQFRDGAFRNEFGQHPDEPAHYVSGLLVRDYIANFQFDSPIAFAENFYLHYPKVALGHWPPFFYVVQAAWTLVFPISRASLLVLIALITALLGTTVFVVTREEFGNAIAAVAGITLLGFPIVQEYSGMLMAEMLVALLCFWATLSFGRFLDNERARDATSFGVLATLAILTKGNGWTLLLVPPIALLFTRRFDLIFRASFWYPPLIVLISCVPWYVVTLEMVQNGWQQELPSVEYTLGALRFFVAKFLSMAGIGLSAAALIGFAVQVIVPARNRRVRGQWAAIAALFLGTFIFHSVVPASLEIRHLILGTPPFVMLIAAGVAWLAARVSFAPFDAKQKNVTASLLLLLVFFAETFVVRRNDWYGFSSVAQRLLSVPAFSNSVFLISSDPRGEGAFIAEVGMREKRPGHIVLRATKVLAGGDWTGKEYYSLFNTPKEVMSYLEEVPVGIVVLDLSLPESKQLQHQRLLKQVIEGHPEVWQFLAGYPFTRDGVFHPNAIHVYQWKGHETNGARNIRIPMDRMLGRDIETKGRR